jgi:hypothetical protein
VAFGQEQTVDTGSRIVVVEPSNPTKYVPVAPINDACNVESHSDRCSKHFRFKWPGGGDFCENTVRIRCASPAIQRSQERAG